MPSWIRGIAGFWVEDKLSDAEFVDAIEFLIESGIIQVEDPRVKELEAENERLIQKSDSLESENERLMQELGSLSLPEQTTTPTPENTLNVGDKLTITIPDGWMEQSFRDPILGHMVYAIVEESTLDLVPPTMISVSIYPIEDVTAEEQYSAQLEKIQHHVKLFPCFDGGGYSHANAFYSYSYSYGVLSHQCDSYGIDEMIFDYSDGTAYVFSFTGKEATHDEFFDTFDNIAIPIYETILGDVSFLYEETP